METLPIELIEYILGDDELCIHDIRNVMLTCKYLRNVVQNSNSIWRSIYLKKWSEYYKYLVDQNTNWIFETRYVYDVRKRVRVMLNTMPPRFHKMSDISKRDMNEWSRLVDETPQTYHYVISHLMELISMGGCIDDIEVVPLITPGNKTLRYYSLKVLKHLRQYKVSKDYIEFEKLPEKCKILERGAVFIAQWCQPEVTVDYEDICAKLDDLAEQTKEMLQYINPHHPLFKVPPEVLLKWKNENLENNQFSAKHSMEIIDAMEMTLFRKNRFSGNIVEFYKPQNSYINFVLENKYGLPITLSIIYESISRRLGINCEPMNIPAHFLLRFQKDESSNSVLFIDAFNVQILPRLICPYSLSSPDRIPRATAYKVIRRMAVNIEESFRAVQNQANFSLLRSILEFLVMICPNDLNGIVNLSRLCMSLNMDTKYIEDIIESTVYDEPQNAENVLKMLKDYEIHRMNEHIAECKPKERFQNIQYAIGMVIEHKLYQYKAVIVDWSPICKANMAWQRTMDIDKLKYKGLQPFYNVIVEDGTHRYVAEENIEITDDVGMLESIEEIGRHFSHFYVNHFVPNAEKEKEYPEDTIVRQNFYQGLLWTNSTRNMSD